MMDLNTLIYGNLDSGESRGRGDMLIAEPMMADPWFGRTAVLMLDGEGGEERLGLVMNRKLPLTLADLFPDWPEGGAVPVYLGGPVDQERLFTLHTLGPELGDSFEIMPGLYAGGDHDKIKAYVETHLETEGKIRFFIGYSGWSAGQLEGEIKRNSWAVSHPADAASLLTGEGQEYWRREVEALGEERRVWLSVPPNPLLN